MGIIHSLLTRVVRFEEIECKCSFKGLGQIKLLLVLLIGLETEAMDGEGLWPLCRKQLSSAPRRTPVVVTVGKTQGLLLRLCIARKQRIWAGGGIQWFIPRMIRNMCPGVGVGNSFQEV